jgi:hypothetical protein
VVCSCPSFGRRRPRKPEAATVPDAELLLNTEGFDLIVVSALLEEWEKGRILSAAGKMRTLVLRRLTLAPELLVEVERMLDNGGLQRHSGLTGLDH